MLSKTLQRYENKSKSQPCERKNIRYRQLSKTLQRYENKSKSQHMAVKVFTLGCCLRLCKDTKIKANHNVLDSSTMVLTVV